MLIPGKRLTLYSIRKTNAGSVWIRCGVVFVNKDESLTIRLDALPLDGALYARDPGVVARPCSETGSANPPVA